MADQTNYKFFGKDFPAIDWGAITPNDSTDLSDIPRAIYVGGDGNIAAVSVEGTEVTFTGVVAGSILPIQPARIKSTNTTATNLIALY